MQLRVWLIIGITGLNICLLPGQEEAWEQHLMNGRKLRTQALYKEAEKEYLAAVGSAEAFGPEDTRLARARTKAVIRKRRHSTGRPPQRGNAALKPRSRTSACA